MADTRQRTNTDQNLDVDIITELPDNVIDMILMCLPTREAAQTCVLSKKWRYRWMKVPQLVIDKELWQQTMRSQYEPRAKFAMILCHILSLHRGPVTKLTLSVPQLKPCPEMDALICFLSRNGIEDFTLRIWLGGRYRLPLSFFMTTSLKHLYLHSCLITLLPSSFNGFRRLISLELHDVLIPAEVLERLISRSPTLEKLVIQTTNVLGYFEIHTPSLKHLAIFSIFRSEMRRSSIVEVFDRLPILEHLRINYHFMKYLATKGFPTRLPMALEHLKVLNIESICLDEVDLLSCVLCLIRSSPNMKTIDISLRSFDVGCTYYLEQYLAMQDYGDLTLNHLRRVKLRGVSGKKSEMELIKLLLSKSLMLNKLIIEPAADTNMKLNILSEVSKFRHASANAQVIVEN